MHVWRSTCILALIGHSSSVCMLGHGGAQYSLRRYSPQRGVKRDEAAAKKAQRIPSSPAPPPNLRGSEYLYERYLKVHCLENNEPHRHGLTHKSGTKVEIGRFCQEGGNLQRDPKEMAFDAFGNSQISETEMHRWRRYFKTS